MNAAAPLPELEDGVYDGLDADVYHAVERLSSSGGKRILKSPAHFRVSRDKPGKPSPQMQLGSAVHFGVLQPDLFARRVICGPEECDKRTKDGKAIWSAWCAAYADAINAGAIVLAPQDYLRAIACIESVRSKAAAMALLAGARVELSLFWTDRQYGVPCKARFDAWNHGGVPDVKTCADASPEGFSNAIGRFLYHMQAATYFSGSEHALNRTPEFFAFIAVETEEPYACAVYEMDRPSILAGMNLWDEALRRYKAALELGAWPGYAEEIRTINAPRWALRDFY